MFTCHPKPFPWGSPELFRGPPETILSIGTNPLTQNLLVGPLHGPFVFGVVGALQDPLKPFSWAPTGDQHGMPTTRQSPGLEPNEPYRAQQQVWGAHNHPPNPKTPRTPQPPNLVPMAPKTSSLGASAPPGAPQKTGQHFRCFMVYFLNPWMPFSQSNLSFTCLVWLLGPFTA